MDLVHGRGGGEGKQYNHDEPQGLETLGCHKAVPRELKQCTQIRSIGSTFLAMDFSPWRRW
ncbi:MAG TPA: hypothetical protein VL947_04255 [Cytophagales bacterium]|nr:hypothetical protein [Cytophagales bacterium]